jgi:hypothetical protein
MSVMLLRSFFSSMTRSRLLFVGTLGIAAACASIPFPNQADQRRPEWWAFTAPWDPRSDSSARANASRLDAIVYGWIPLDSISGQPFDLYADERHAHGARDELAQRPLSSGNDPAARW